MPVRRPFFSYYGGKWRSARRYGAPEHKLIIEPFAGSAGYSVKFATERHKVILIERDPIVAGIWKYLIEATADDILELPKKIEPGQSLDDFPDIEKSAKHLIGFWLNRGVASPCKTPSSWMQDPQHANSFWGEKVRARIARQVGDINSSNWEIRETSYDQAEYPQGDATWFIDPPYKVAGKYYRFGNDEKNINYDELGKWCAERMGQVIVCENQGADWMTFDRLGSTKTTRKGKPSEEVF